jgi:flagellum-specific peptidoglycan hydrolase FlgJ
MLFGTSPKETGIAKEDIEVSSEEDSMSSEEEETSEYTEEESNEDFSFDETSEVFEETSEEISIEESSCFEDEESSEDTTIEESSEEDSNVITEEDNDKHLMGVSPPDIITDLNVIIYNYHSSGYNTEDALIYLNDIKYYLDLYAPEGMWISAAMAQAYTEGGAGKDQGVYARTNNCFGITAGPGWSGYVYARNTGRVYKDYSTAVRYGETSRTYGGGGPNLFRAYKNMEDSVKDYVNLISTTGYSGALNTNSPEEYLQYLLNRRYGEQYMYYTWTSLIQQFNLKQYDN